MQQGSRTAARTERARGGIRENAGSGTGYAQEQGGIASVHRESMAASREEPQKARAFYRMPRRGSKGRPEGKGGGSSLKQGSGSAASSWKEESGKAASSWKQESGGAASLWKQSGGHAASGTVRDTAGSVAEKGLASAGAGASTAAGGAVGASALAGKKAAERFKAHMQEKSMATDRYLQDAAKRCQDIRSENEGIGTMPSFAKHMAATMGAAALSALALALHAFLSFLAMLVAAVLSMLVPLAIIISIIAAVCAILFSASQNRSGYGLPPFITEDMMEAFFEEQSENGIPVSTGVAQAIQESGFGRYGPGGEEGKGLSKLAYDYKNLFGIKFSSRDEYASGAVNMRTGEETPTGGSYVITDAFSVYPSYADCIRQRTGMLLNARYFPHVSPYLNRNDGSYTREEANGFAAGIKSGGWATSTTYTEGLIDKMEKYDLYQFDNMTYEEFQQGLSTWEEYNGTVTPTMERIVQVAESNTGAYPCTPDYCARWVRGVYEAAGAPTIPWGNAIDVWNVHKDTGSTDLSNIPPGAIVCGSGVGSMGALYGHVGIYLGDGMVVSNVGRHKIETLESFGNWQTANCQGHVGLIGWVFPGGVPRE